MTRCGGRAYHGRRFLAASAAPVRIACLGCALAVASCVAIPNKPRALLVHDDGSVHVQTLQCPQHVEAALVATSAEPAHGLDPEDIRLVTWNIHKQSDAGWQHDLQRFAEHNDLVLLQETVLDPSLRAVMDDQGMRFVMASSFLASNVDIGVLTASRVAPLANCTQRFVEPLLRIPKSAVISWFPLRGQSRTLAVVNVHAINFSLSLGTYRSQIDAIADALEGHAGPIIVAGDFNTWTDERAAAVRALAARLDLTEVRFAPDRRSHFLGHELDHIYVRDLAPLATSAIAVTSSDHNPVAATLRLAH
jgi:endonuclease/exonuclease/phosphatase (EEP) superfamily protein YafD